MMEFEEMRWFGMSEVVGPKVTGFMYIKYESYSIKRKIDIFRHNFVHLVWPVFVF